jgi:hypothetical protein
MYYYRARYYSPAFQRFASQDPLEFGAGDPNLYAYVHNTPTQLNDPTGQQAEMICEETPLCEEAGESLSNPDKCPWCSSDRGSEPHMPRRRRWEL